MKTFTPTQARAILPILEREMQRLQPMYKELRIRFEQCAARHGLPVDDARLREICLGEQDIRELFFQVEECLCFFSELGVECKGIEKGLIDFPCLFSDRIVYLCWKVGESAITHWHEIDAEFSARRPLLDGDCHGVEAADRLPH
jgi:hypothetical protein